MLRFVSFFLVFLALNVGTMAFMSSRFSCRSTTSIHAEKKEVSSNSPLLNKQYIDVYVCIYDEQDDIEVLSYILYQKYVS